MVYTTENYIMTGGSFVANEKTVVIRRDVLTPDRTCQPYILEVIAKVDPNRCDRKKAVKERGDSEKSEWGSRPHGKRREGGISE